MCSVCIHMSARTIVGGFKLLLVVGPLGPGDRNACRRYGRLKNVDIQGSLYWFLDEN